MQEEFIWIVPDDLSEYVVNDTQKGSWGDAVSPDIKRGKGVKINALELEQRMAAFLTVVGRLFQQAEQKSQQYSTNKNNLQLDEVDLSVSISAEGEIKLIAGLKTGINGVINLKFKRSVK
ncbi:hypothetical protein [Acaryochloris sp. CCMEE 5410]|uniref:Pepco domain-containing protein n=1 Tax=Acaryochloris sp. CCMEE 5410 TaxID=310037 RepID=UPI0002F68CB3|nr:hypothetical protein [Acaryochloris sp. CCMEE 5410]